MDIVQAIERVSALRDDVRRIDKMLDRLLGEGWSTPPKISADIAMDGFAVMRTTLDRDGCLGLLRSTKADHMDEIARLQPVIDTANAALRGIGV